MAGGTRAKRPHCHHESIVMKFIAENDEWRLTNDQGPNAFDQQCWLTWRGFGTFN